MASTRGYGSPAAFRRALTDKLRAKAETSQWTLQQLRRQMAYDRLLERLYLVDDGWVVKGATALLARDIGVRATIDIDVYREAAREVAEADLRSAVARDIGDWFTFELGAGRPVAVGAPGVRIPVSAYIGPTVWASFNVDLVGSDLRMTREPDPVPPLARVVMPDVEQHGYRAYPLVDHIADKVVAMFEPHGERGMPSTRFKGPRGHGRDRAQRLGGRGAAGDSAAIGSQSAWRCDASAFHRSRPIAVGTGLCSRSGPITRNGETSGKGFVERVRNRQQ
jgi:hypothetical protein